MHYLCLNDVNKFVSMQVSIPSVPERSEWRLDGRTLPLTVSLTTTAGELKALLQRATNMPTAKQKLHYEVSGLYSV